VNEPAFASPQALGASLAARLRSLAAAHRTQPGNLRRQFAYDRLLARIFHDDPDAWVLKGAAAIIARLGPRSRHTRDIDLYGAAGTLDEAEDALREAAAVDLSDYFRFEIAPGRPVPGPVSTRRLKVTAYLGATLFETFPLDLVTDLNMTAEPELIGPLVPIDVPGIEPARYRVYPVVDHIADKVCAIHELHERAAGPPVASSRFRDLADLSTFARTTTVEANALKIALASEADRRHTELPATVTVPSDAAWRAGYARIARETPALVDRDVDAAIATARRFIDPILTGVAAGVWDLQRLEWPGANAAGGNEGS
jgi:hypothetical protein